jgi:electron transport complex protein RnfC
MAAFIRKDHLDGAERAGVTDCFSCGSCSYVCPSHIPLVQFFNYAKGELAAQGREKRRLDQVKALSESRSQRLERQAQAKREAAAAAAAARKAASATSENKASQ